MQATNRPLGEVEVIRYVTVNPTNGGIFRYVTLAVFPLRNYNYHTDNETEIHHEEHQRDRGKPD